ncbi:hypothetical protein DL765_007450 [Monosporascus sp. GIB2]|nr:hypothetical protein DL765_007450 [Monosporascus sp. GIB2]
MPKTIPSESGMRPHHGLNRPLPQARGTRELSLGLSGVSRAVAGATFSNELKINIFRIIFPTSELIFDHHADEDAVLRLLGERQGFTQTLRALPVLPVPVAADGLVLLGEVLSHKLENPVEDHERVI